jgi:hypothetical protein
MGIFTTNLDVMKSPFPYIYIYIYIYVCVYKCHDETPWIATLNKQKWLLFKSGEQENKTGPV